jgi:hypothetical protein
MICTVVIPVYKEFKCLSKSEIQSLSQCFKKLIGHHFIFIGPTHFNFHDYLLLANENSSYAKVQRFDNHYFESINGYNLLLLSRLFYRKFRNYQYILIYQTDAWVFKNELLMWCKSGYDYIGAPWFSSFSQNITTSNIIGVGNGGFSLRNVKKMISILQRIRVLKFLYSIWCNFKIDSHISFNKIILTLNFYFKIKAFWELPSLLSCDVIQEDEFYGHIVSKLFFDFHLAPISEALKFSFEVNPRYLFEMNNYKLPFGCHAWEKYDRKFWDEHLLYNQN